MDFTDREKLGDLLAELYKAQKQASFADRVMQIFIEQVKLTEEQAIGMLKIMIQEEWLVAGGCKLKFLLRPGYVFSFPVVLSSKGLEYIRKVKR